MAFVHGKNGRMAVAGNALAAYFSSQSISASIDTAETTVFTSPAKEFIPGLYAGSVSLDGFFEATANNLLVSDVLLAVPGSAVTIAPAGFAVGSPTIDCLGLATTYSTTSDVADAVKASIEFQTSGVIDYGYALADMDVAKSVTADGATFDGGASSANGGLAVLQVSSVTGGSVTAKVQHSSDGTTWTDLASFTAASGTTSQRVTVAGTVNRYLRASWTQTATSASFAVTFSRR
jgi:hypothetical protein